MTESIDVMKLIRGLAQRGTAPIRGCSLLGVGYEDAFDRLEATYLRDAFDSGESSVKFVVGPFGSGKTHFLRQLAERARDLGCATSEVPLNKDLDYTKSLVVYREVAQELWNPVNEERGIGPLLLAGIAKRRALEPNDAGIADALVSGWIDGLRPSDFKLQDVGRVAKIALRAEFEGNRALFDGAVRWIEGAVTEKDLARTLGVSAVAAGEANRYGQKMLLSLFQLVRKLDLQGTVLAYDEAEQGFEVDRKRFDRILSMLQATINALADLEDGSALIVFAFTPNLRDQMAGFPALQQRIEDPGRNRTFFDGNTLAPIIDLTKDRDLDADLRAIGRRLADLFYDHSTTATAIPRSELYATMDRIADEIAMEEGSTSSRRAMARRAATELINLADHRPIGTANDAAAVVEDEV